MRKITLFAMVFMATLSGGMFAQQAYFDQDGKEVVRCETMDAHERLLDRNPNMESLDEFENWLAPLIEEQKRNNALNSNKITAVTTIPIVFHIIHNGEAVGSGRNISATYVNAQVDQLNYDFRRTPGTSGYNTDARGADTEIEFCLATVDPGGNTLSEPGINRVNRSSQGWSAPPYGVCLAGGGYDDSYIENTIKPATSWNPNNYLNVWVMETNCGILGYAQFPSSSGLSGIGSNGGASNTDGVVLLYTSIGSSTTPYPGGAPYNLGRTGTHEVGHWLGLRHIWGDANCGNDYCGDTPQASGPASGCPNKTTCDGNRDMVENYMDYSYDNCMNIFTADQKTRMQTVLANSPRRNTLGASTACGGGTPPAPCGTTVSSFPYNETFESSFGAWSQVSGDDFDWSRLSGATPSSNTGPTSAAGGSFYTYIEVSSPNYPSKTALLAGPCFNLSSATSATFSFSYHMYGAATMGGLVLEVSDNGGPWTSVWSRTGNQGNAWNTASVNLNAYTGGTIQLRFAGSSGDTWQGDIAVDNIQMTVSSTPPSSCSSTISSFPYSNGFESSFGGWTQGTGDDFDWSRRSGSTPSSNTGPSSAAAGSYYAYIEVSSPNYPSKTAYLEGPCFNLSSVSNPEVSFQYHMYGAAGMGALSLQAKPTGGSWSTLWTQSGNKGNAWLSANVDLSAYTGTVQLRFVGTSGNTWQGDIAVDDIAVSAAGPSCGTVNLTLTFDDYPEETSWEIRQGGSVVASGGTYGSEPDGSTLIESVCLPDGCYDFIISDAYGDGICCTYGNGSYTLRNSNNAILASGGNFTSSETTAFCLSGGLRTGTSTVTQAQSSVVPLDKEFGLFPNPTSGLLNVAYRSSSDANVTVKVIDPLGRVVMTENWNMVQGMNQNSIRIKGAATGTYVLMVSNGEQQISQRFVVIK